MYIRFNKNGLVDSIVPTNIGIQPNHAPGDIIWLLPTDINPSKTINMTENVQAVDPVSGLPFFDENGNPVWKTTTVTNSVSVTVPATTTVQQEIYQQDGTPYNPAQYETITVVQTEEKPVQVELYQSDRTPYNPPQYETVTQSFIVYTTEQQTTTSEQIVTQEVPYTYTLTQNPGIFTKDDILAILINPPTVVS